MIRIYQAVRVRIWPEQGELFDGMFKKALKGWAVEIDRHKSNPQHIQIEMGGRLEDREMQINQSIDVRQLEMRSREEAVEIIRYIVRSMARWLLDKAIESMRTGEHRK